MPTAPASSSRGALPDDHEEAAARRERLDPERHWHCPNATCYLTIVPGVNLMPMLDPLPPARFVLYKDILRNDRIVGSEPYTVDFKGQAGLFVRSRRDHISAPPRFPYNFCVLGDCVVTSWCKHHLGIMLQPRRSDKARWPGAEDALKCPGCARVAQVDTGKKYVAVMHVIGAAATQPGMHIALRNMPRVFCMPCWDHFVGNQAMQLQDESGSVFECPMRDFMDDDCLPFYARVDHCSCSGLSEAISATYARAAQEMERDSGGTRAPTVTNAHWKMGKCEREGCNKLGMNNFVRSNGKPGLRQCSACRMVGYCGPDCQRADWPRHKPLCKQVSTARRQIPQG